MSLVFKNKKGAGLPIETLILIILLSAFLIIAVLIFVGVKKEIGYDFVQDYSCKTNLWFRSQSAIFRTFLPATCTLKEVEQPIGQDELAKYMRRAWWIYGKGQYNLGMASDEIFPHFAVTIKEDIDIGQFLYYLVTHSKGQSSTEMESDYQYLQEGSKGQTICFDTETIPNKRLEKGSRYFIIFYDDQELIGESREDRLLISKSSAFDKNTIGSFFGRADKCWKIVM